MEEELIVEEEEHVCEYPIPLFEGYEWMSVCGVPTATWVFDPDNDDLCGWYCEKHLKLVLPEERSASEWNRLLKVMICMLAIVLIWRKYG